MIETQKHIRKPLYVDAARVTNDNFEEIAKWCQGEIIVPGIDDEGFRGDKKYIKVRVHNPKNPRQTKAFVGDWLLYTERGYKVYTNKAFHASFDPVNETNGSVTTPPTPIEEVAPPSLEMAQAVETIEAEGGTVEPATPEAIANAVEETAKTVLSLEDQAGLSQEEIRELLKSGEYVLVQDQAA